MMSKAPVYGLFSLFVCMLFVTAAFADPANLDDGLITYLSFDNNSLDYSQYNHQVRIEGGLVYSSGVKEQAADFDGVDDRLYISDNLSSVSISLWFNARDIFKRQTLIMTGDAGSCSYKPRLSICSGYLIFVGSGCSNSGFIAKSLIEANKWYHVVIIFESGNQQLWINGKLVGSNNISQSFGGSPTAIGCGASSAQVNTYFTGLIDELRIYDRKLSPADIFALYSQNSSNSDLPLSELIAYYPLDGNGLDASGNGHDGIVTGATAAADRFGHENSALFFDGQDDFVRVPPDDELNLEQFTIGVWMKMPLDSTKHSQKIILKGAAGYDRPGEDINYLIAVIDRKPHVQFEEYDGTNHELTSDFTLDDKWHFILATYDKSQLKMYGDGTLIGSLSTSATPVASSFPLDIGRNTLSGYDNFFYGYLDDIWIFKKALTNEEVLSLYNNSGLNTGFSDKVVYLPFDNNAQTIGCISSADPLHNIAPTYVPGKHGNALHLNGNEEFVIPGGALNRNSSLTITGWVKPEFSGDETGTIVFERDKNGNDVCGGVSAGNFGLQIYHGQFAFELSTLKNGSCIHTRLLADTDITPDEYYFLTAVYNKETEEAYLFVNGELKDHVEQIGNELRTTPNAILRIGQNSPKTSQYWLGDLDEITIYNRALSDPEIQALYNGENGSLPLFDDFEDGTIDSSRWYTNGMGWYGYTSYWSPDVRWEENSGILCVYGIGDFISQQIILPENIDSDNAIYKFRIRLGHEDNGGLYLDLNPFGSPPLQNAIVFSVHRGQRQGYNGFYITVKQNGIYIINKRVFDGFIQEGTWYDVTISVTEQEDGQALLKYAIAGLGSGEIVVPRISRAYKVGLFARGAWGVHADTCFDNVYIGPADGRSNGGECDFDHPEFCYDDETCLHAGLVWSSDESRCRQPEMTELPSGNSVILSEPERSEPGRLLYYQIGKSAVELSEVESINDTNPIVIIVHGWNRTGETLDSWDESWPIKMASLIKEKSPDTNVLLWEWLEQAHTFTPPSNSLMDQQALYLTNKILRSLQCTEYLNSNEPGMFPACNDIHFIAHSAGGRVAYSAVNYLAKEHVTVDLLTLLDPYIDDISSDVFGGIRKMALDPQNSDTSVGTILLDAIENKLSLKISYLFNVIPATKANFLDNYTNIVASLELLNLDPATMKSKEQWIANELLRLIYLSKYLWSSLFNGVSATIIGSQFDFLPSVYFQQSVFFNDPVEDSVIQQYFVSGSDLISEWHHAPVNWYMASIFDHLNYRMGSSQHHYGFYWSPVLGSNERPNKYDWPALSGFENYYDLFGTSQLVTDTVDVTVELVNETIDYTEKLAKRLYQKAKEVGKFIMVLAVDSVCTVFEAGEFIWKSSEPGTLFWQSLDNLSSGVLSYFGDNCYILAHTASPVVFSRQYTIPKDADLLAFSYDILDADKDDSVEVFINDENIYSFMAAPDKGGPVTLSDFIRIGKWAGQTVTLSFRINSYDGKPLIMRLFDIIFAQNETAKKLFSQDTDEDGLIDFWEVLFLGDLSSSGSDDNDQDGLTNIEEQDYHTNPVDVDTDNDGFSDGEEAALGSQPLDPENHPEILTGDLDYDGDIDRDDVNIVMSHRNQSAEECIECDIDGDGKITVLDARKVITMCTCPRCVCSK